VRGTSGAQKIRQPRSITRIGTGSPLQSCPAAGCATAEIPLPAASSWSLVVLWVLSAFGVLGPLASYRVGS
jgi:hypothetical protein